MLRRLPRWSLVALPLGIALLAALAIWLAGQKPNVRTTVFTFEAAMTDAELPALAEGIAAEVVGTMNEIGLDAISRAETEEASAEARLLRASSLGAAFALDGHIAHDGRTVRVWVRLDDVRARQTIWSQTFERPDTTAGALRLEVAARTVGVMRCAAQARRELPILDHALMTLLLRSCAIETDYVHQVEALELARQFAQALPRSSLAQGRLASVAVPALDDTPQSMQAQLREEALEAADLALRLDPHNGTAAAARLWLLLSDQTREQRERGIVDALRAAPDDPELNTFYSYFLREVGRNEEAVAYARRALARDPLSPYRVYSLVWCLAITGHSQEALQLLSGYVERWPGENDIWTTRFRLSLWFDGSDRFLQLLNEAPPNTVSPGDLVCWRRAAEGLAAVITPQRRRAAALVRACPNADPAFTIQVLGAVGDLDGAYAIAEQLEAREGRRSWWGMMFEPSAHEVRRDSRFMPLMQRVGLISYWRSSGRWPDFCAEPDLAYDCRAEAARLMSQAR
jgi:TolB-like protein